MTAKLKEHVEVSPIGELELLELVDALETLASEIGNLQYPTITTTPSMVRQVVMLNELISVSSTY